MYTKVCVFFAVLCAAGAVQPQVQEGGAAATLEQLETRAQAAYDAKHYPEALALVLQISPLTQDTERANIEYSEACLFALTGQKEEAFRTLDAAVVDGWSNVEHTAADSDLALLHDDSRWSRLLEHMKAKIEAEELRWDMDSFKTPYAENLSEAEKVAGLSELWAEAKFGFANFWHVPQLNWDQTYQNFIPQVLATKSTAEYYRVLERFYALLQDGHTGVWPSGPQDYPVPVESHKIDGLVLVVRASDAAFDMDGVNPGDQIVAINGQTVEEWARENVDPYLMVSSAQQREWRLWNTWYLMRGPTGTVFQVTTRSPDGKTSQHRWATGKQFPTEMVNSIPAEAFAFRMLPGGVAYVALNEFQDNQDADEWDKHWDVVKSAKALVLDLRHNGGGNSSVGWHILATLLDKPLPGALTDSPTWIAANRAWGQPEPIKRYPAGTLKADPDRHFAGKVVVLAGPGTFSAAEDFVMMFASGKRGVIVGEATGGSIGSLLRFSLPGGAVAWVCTTHYRFPDGREFNGVGVQPDIPAHLTRHDLLTGGDSVLDAAVQAARN